MADLSQVVSNTRDSIGRYFSLVSAVPSAILVVWTGLLVCSGAWSAEPDVAAALRLFTDMSIGGAAALVFVTIGLGVITHPIQFALVQFLEGYWGSGPLATRARHVRTVAHWSDWRRLRTGSAEVGMRVKEAKKAKDQKAEAGSLRLLDAEIADMQADRRELKRLLGNYPLRREEFMPTRLGNILRRHERAVGNGYGLESITAVPYLLSVAEPNDVEYLDDQRSQLDLSARMTVVSLLATGLTVLFLARHGAWLLVALAPYGAAYVAYRGALVAAAEYGGALGVVLTLNRFALYERLQLERPVDTDAERRQNEELTHFLRHGYTEELSLRYRPEPVAPQSDDRVEMRRSPLRTNSDD